ncbi:mast cell carboxypeptidase A-like [Pelobates fuscus]|uniref:mast cell carboxypeptidase A-like n=1 Tax=Pelobates fuscus TaxID=191477 RepID=UPI002FE4423E
MPFLWIWIFVTTAFLVSSKLTYHGDKVFRVKVQSEEHIKLIQIMDNKFKLDFWNPDSVKNIKPQMTVDFHVNAKHTDSIQRLLAWNTVDYEVLFHDLQKGIAASINNQTVQESRKHQYTVYNEWEKIAEWTGKIVAKYPKLVTRLDIGCTGEGRPMYVLKIGKPSGKSKAVFMDCGIHAREWISPAFCQWFVKELTKGYSKGKAIQKLLNELTFYILPVLNVDGYVYSWMKNRMWRKNRSPVPDSNCFGADLNRNFNVSWCDIGSSDDPCSNIYCGPSPESEKETQNVANFIRGHLDSIKAYISIHSYSQLLLYPFAYTFDLAPNAKNLDSISKAAVSKLSKLYGTQYAYGQTASTLYRTSGSSTDWAYTQGVKYSFTFELRDEGKYGFLLPEAQIEPTCKETTRAVKYMAKYILQHS